MYNKGVITDLEQLTRMVIEQNQSLVNEVRLLKTEIKQLQEENAELREKLLRYEHPKDSHNSHLPSSKNPIHKKKNLRIPTSLSSGGQKGHPGKTLEFQVPDQVAVLSSNYCTHFGKSLSEIEGEITERRQQIDIPPVSLIVTEYRQVRKVCTCHQVSKGEFPAGVTSGVSYGEGVYALVTYLSVCQHIPYNLNWRKRVNNDE